MSKSSQRCPWAGDDPLYCAYHDEEWGVPQHEDRMLFELLILEGAQAGLSWITVLRKRQNYREAFDQFDAKRISRYDDKKVAELMANPGIVRNRLKIAATILNAKAFLQVQKEFGTFDRYIWQFVDGKPLQHHFQFMKEIPAKSSESDRMSKDLLKRGFKFVGSTICYAYMQAVGMVNDHLSSCERYNVVRKLR
ncbi:MAG: DNA-3-methyladenine glycosylase I [Verrucomicrobiota bacterium]|nr:DNA-3-methyladenine glycosylase I [Verrucomicrobiota bacterium]